MNPTKPKRPRPRILIALGATIAIAGIVVAWTSWQNHVERKEAQWEAELLSMAALKFDALKEREPEIYLQHKVTTYGELVRLRPENAEYKQLLEHYARKLYELTHEPEEALNGACKPFCVNAPQR